MIEDIEKYIEKLRTWACMRCRVCGGEMTFASSGRDGTKYTCKKAAEGVTKYKWGTDEERENTKHYHDSVAYDRKISTMSVFNGVANDLEKLLRRSASKTIEEEVYRCPDITSMGMCPYTGVECPVHLENCPDRPRSSNTTAKEEVNHTE